MKNKPLTEATESGRDFYSVPSAVSSDRRERVRDKIQKIISHREPREKKKIETQPFTYFKQKEGIMRATHPRPFQPSVAIFHCILCLLILLLIGTASAGDVQPPAPEKTEEMKKDEKPVPPRIEERVVTELRVVPFQKVRQSDDTLPRGVVKVVQQGRQGRERVTYRIREENGVPLEKTVLGTEVLSSPRPHIERVGTAPQIVQRTVTEIVPIPFQKDQKPDESLPAGTLKVIQAGREGQEKITYRITITDGKETDRVVVASEVASLPMNQIEAVGTGKPVQEPPSPPPPVIEAK